jgi:hypothetical protein
VEQRQPAGDGFCALQIVRDHDGCHGMFLLQLENQLINLAGGNGIKTAVGSSSSRMSGSKASARASPTRFCMPPEISEGIFLRSLSIPRFRNSWTRSPADFGCLAFCIVLQGKGHILSTVSES